MLRTIVFYDMEFTTWEGALENNWSAPGQYREVVQIAAMRFDLDRLEEVDEFDILVKPVRNPVLSDFFVQLTGVTNAEVAQKGLSFPEAFRAFTAFAQGDRTVCYGWDADVMRENLGFNGMPDAPEDFDSFSIRPWFQTEGAAYGVGPTTNSGKLAAAVGAPMTVIQEHNALHDVRSIAAAYRFLLGKGAVSPF